MPSPRAPGAAGLAHATSRTLVALAALSLCACDEPEGPAARFAEVAKVLEGGCLATTCHGVDPHAEGEVIGAGLHLRVSSTGALLDLAEARATTLAASGDTTPTHASALLRKPLDPAYGGGPHLGGVAFTSPDAPGYRTLAAWLEAERAAGHLPEPPALSPLAARFAAEVEPALFARGCANRACHGPGSAVPFHLEALHDGARSASQTLANYSNARAMLSLGGDGAGSRVIKKGLPPHAGGVVHKGGNLNFFAPDDPAVAAITAWACAERAAATGAPCDASPPPLDLVFVRGPPHALPYDDLTVFAPGTHLVRARADATGLREDVLTAALGPLAERDARDPAVDPRGERVAFAWRAANDHGHHLALLDLATLAVTDLTPAGPHDDREPAWGPDGRLWFVSNRAATLTDDARHRDAELYSLDPARPLSEPRRHTFSPQLERRPTAYAIGTEAGGELAFTASRTALPHPRAHVFRFPPGLATEYHQHFGITTPEDFVHDLRELPDGRYLGLVGALASPEVQALTATGLGVVDRNFGPELGPDLATSLPFYAAPLTRLDHDALFRDPAPCPAPRAAPRPLPHRLDHGALAHVDALVAVASRPPDLALPEHVDFALAALAFTESPDGAGPRVAALQVLIDSPGLWDFDPEPVAILHPLPPAEPHAPSDAPVGLLRHHGLPIIDALLSHLQPGGPKPVRPDLRAVRVVSALPLTAAERRPLAPDEHPFAPTSHPAASTTSLLPIAPSRILAELPLAPDGTFQLELPAEVPFRLQNLDADGMVVGVQHNRWYHLERGQVMTQGIGSEALYRAHCAACHGGLDGAPEHVFGADAVSSASLTLSRYESGDPRRPLPPAVATPFAVDFVRDVGPLLARRCALPSCHAGPDPTGLDLEAHPTRFFDRAYEALLAPGAGSGGGGHLVDLEEGRARRSHLVERLLGRELDAPASLPLPGRPHPEPALTPDELTLVVRWLESGAAYRLPPASPAR